jgi:hypothetical protein
VGQPPEWNKDEDSVQPGWWPWWLSDFDVESALGFSHGSSGDYIEEYGHRWHQPWRTWALLNGVAPGQLFCVAVETPSVHKSGWETIEYDVEWDGYLLEVAPISKAAALHRWEHDARAMARWRLAHMQVAAQNAAIVDSDIGRMYIAQHMYVPSRYSDSWGVPTGRSLSLLTTHRLHPCAATCINSSGRDDGGNFEVAMAELIENACKKNPRLTPDLLRSLEVRR